MAITQRQECRKMSYFSMSMEIPARNDPTTRETNATHQCTVTQFLTRHTTTDFFVPEKRCNFHRNLFSKVGHFQDVSGKYSDPLKACIVPVANFATDTGKERKSFQKLETCVKTKKCGLKTLTLDFTDLFKVVLSWAKVG